MLREIGFECAASKQKTNTDVKLQRILAVLDALKSIDPKRIALIKQKLTPSVIDLWKPQGEEVNIYNLVNGDPVDHIDSLGLAFYIDTSLLIHLLGRAAFIPAEYAAELGVCRCLPVGQTAQVRSPVSILATLALMPVLDPGGYVLLEVTKNRPGWTECDWRYIVIGGTSAGGGA